MEAITVRGAAEVANLLRSLAEQIDHKAMSIDGRPVPLSESLEAVINVVDEKDVSLVDIRLEHPSPAAWDLIELQQAMAHPGD